jgi:hypothetical protein
MVCQLYAGTEEKRQKNTTAEALLGDAMSPVSCYNSGYGQAMFVAPEFLVAVSRALL